MLLQNCHIGFTDMLSSCFVIILYTFYCILSLTILQVAGMVIVIHIANNEYMPKI